MANTPKIFVDPPWTQEGAGTGIPFLPISQQAQSVFAAAPAADDPPEMKPMGMPSGMPSVFARPAPAPEVSREKTPIETQIGETDQQLRKLQQKDANPFGSPNNHPGVFGKILHGLSVAGNIAGDVALPGVMANIPQTTLGRRVQEAGLTERLQGLARQRAEDEASEAATAKTKLQTEELPQQAADTHDVAQAQAGNLDAETDARRHPPADYELHDTPDGILRVDKKSGNAQFVTVDGKTVGSPIKTETKQLKIDGKPHEVLINSQTGMPIKDLGESGFKPSVVNVNAGVGALDREAKQFGTPHQKALDAVNAQLEKIADARAMINGNAESQGLGIPKVLTALVGGQGTGVRITQAELTSIAHARGLSGDVEGTLSKWAGKGALSKDQQQQLTQIMDDVKTRILQKQAIVSGALDSINGASTREQIIEADKNARKQLTDLENGNNSGGGDSSKPAHSLKTAMALPFNQGKSEADVRKDLETHGYKVVP